VLNELGTSLNIIHVIKTRRMIWTVHVARKSKRRGKRSRGRDLGLDGRIIVK
jgi:hypothetical protein